MRFLTARRATAFLLIAGMSGCASHSEQTAIWLDRTNPKFKTQGCQDSLAAAELHRDIKTTRMVASPVLLFLSGGLLLPVVAANAGLDTVDHVDAAKMAENCGGVSKSNAEIAGEVAAGAAVGFATSGLTGTGLTSK